MALVRWSPLASDMVNLSDTLNRVFQDSWQMNNWPATREMAVNMKETEDHIIVTTPIPGISPEDLDINISDNLLTIKAESKQENKQEEKGYLVREYSSASYFRQVSLPANVQSDQADADTKDGILTITLQKKPESKPKRITVRGK